MLNFQYSKFCVNDKSTHKTKDRVVQELYIIHYYKINCIFLLQLRSYMIIEWKYCITKTWLNFQHIRISPWGVQPSTSDQSPIRNIITIEVYPTKFQYLRFMNKKLVVSKIILFWRLKRHFPVITYMYVSKTNNCLS